MENIEQTSLEIKERFAKVNVQIQEKDITERLSILVNRFRVPLNEARRNVTNYFLRVHNINQDEFFANAGFANQSPLKIAELIEDNKGVLSIQSCRSCGNHAMRKHSRQGCSVMKPAQ